MRTKVRTPYLRLNLRNVMKWMELIGRTKVGLVLGGGGVRGISNIGVLKVFQEEGLPIDLIVGISMGAIIGGAYCLNKKIQPLLESVHNVLSQKEILNLESDYAEEIQQEDRKHRIRRLADFVKTLFQWNLQATKKYLVEIERIEPYIKALVGDKTFAQTQIPFLAVATDLKTGDEVVIKEGNLAQAILASASIPGIFSPVELGGRTLIDGGILGVAPVEVARKNGADFVIAVNTEKGIEHRHLHRGVDILFQVSDIKTKELNSLKLAASDFVVEPKVKTISWAHFSKAVECIKRGERAAQQALPQIQRSLAKMRRKNALKIFFRPFLAIKDFT